jgi:hypothetical protein
VGTQAGIAVHPTSQIGFDVLIQVGRNSYTGLTRRGSNSIHGGKTQQGSEKLASYQGAIGAVGLGVGFALTVAVMNGLSRYLFGGDSISERALNKFGGAN